LRYLTPFGQFHDLSNYLDSVRPNPEAEAAGEPDVILPILDDGEKYGVWPGTHGWVYGDRWLEKFCEFVTHEDNAVRCELPSEVLDRVPAAGTVYLPDASYQEMGVWALPPQIGKRVDDAIHAAERDGRIEDAKRLYNAGTWRNFLVKYPESGRMHANAVRTSELIRDAEEAGRLSGEKLDEARRLVERGQCNCAYWHGVFGGLYLPHLRRALYESFIGADTIEWAARGSDEPQQIRADVNTDGVDEVVVRSEAASWAVEPRGGAIMSWQIRRNALEILNSLARRFESYHDAPVRDGEGGDQGHATIHDRVKMLSARQADALVYDPHQRLAGQDHFFAELLPAEQHRLNQAHDEGDAPNRLWALQDTPDPLVQTLTTVATIRRDGQAWPVTLTKTLTFDAISGGLTYAMRFELAADAPGPLGTWYAPEFNFAFFAGNDPQRHYELNEREKKLGSRVDDAKSPTLIVRSVPEDIAVTLRGISGTEVTWRAYPVETVSQSERDFEMIFQSACVLPHIRLDIEPGAAATATLRLDVAPAGR
jgi:hypothetical protein